MSRMCMSSYDRFPIGRHSSSGRGEPADGRASAGGVGTDTERLPARWGESRWPGHCGWLQRRRRRWEGRSVAVGSEEGSRARGGAAEERARSHQPAARLSARRAVAVRSRRASRPLARPRLARGAPTACRGSECDSGRNSSRLRPAVCAANESHAADRQVPGREPQPFRAAHPHQFWPCILSSYRTIVSIRLRTINFTARFYHLWLFFAGFPLTSWSTVFIYSTFTVQYNWFFFMF